MAKLYFYYASMNAGEAVHAGEQIEIGGNEGYIAQCRKHFMEKMVG